MRFGRSQQKYSAERTVYDGHKFDSKNEARYYGELKLLENARAIKIIELQPKVYLTRARLLYKPDFLIEEKGQLVWVDYKGFETPVFRLKRKLWKFYGPGPLRIIKSKGGGFYVDQEVSGKEDSVKPKKKKKKKKSKGDVK